MVDKDIGIKKSEFVAKTHFLEKFEYWDPLHFVKYSNINISTFIMISNQVDLKVIMFISKKLHESLTYTLIFFAYLCNPMCRIDLRYFNFKIRYNQPI